MNPSQHPDLPSDLESLEADLAALAPTTGALNRVRAHYYLEKRMLDGSWSEMSSYDNPGVRLRIEQLYSDAEPRCRSHQTTWTTNVESNLKNL